MLLLDLAMQASSFCLNEVKVFGIALQVLERDFAGLVVVEETERLPEVVALISPNSWAARFKFLKEILPVS